MEKIQRIAGKDRGEVLLYTLSTCIWCRKTKQLLERLGVAYSYIELDRLSGAEKDEAVAELLRWNPDRSFPTMVINEQRSIIGYKEEEIAEVFGVE